MGSEVVAAVSLFEQDLANQVGQRFPGVVERKSRAAGCLLRGDAGRVRCEVEDQRLLRRHLRADRVLPETVVGGGNFAPVKGQRERVRLAVCLEQRRTAADCRHSCWRTRIPLPPSSA